MPRARLTGPEANFRNLFLVYKRNARNRSLPFDLTPERFRFLTKQTCFLCGAKPSSRYRHSRKKKQYARAYIYNGIDRVKNKLGYIEGNVISCCWKCNCAKSDRSLADFLLNVLAIFNHRIKGDLPK